MEKQKGGDVDISIIKQLTEELPISYLTKSCDMEEKSHLFRLAEYNLEIMKAKKFLEFKATKGSTVDELKAKVIVATQEQAYQVVITETAFRKAKAELIGIEKSIESIKELSAFLRREMKTIPLGEIEHEGDNKKF